MSSQNRPQLQASRKPEISFLIGCNVPYKPDRLGVSSGIQLASRETTGQDYGTDAHIPRLPFSPFDGIGLLDANNTATPVRAQTVGLFKLNDRLLETLRRAAAQFHDPSDLRLYIDDVCSELPPPWTVREAPPQLTLGRNAAGLQTVTQDPITRAYVGLHVDTFDLTYDAARAQAGNRISINVGAGTRFFLFVPLAYKSLCVSNRVASDTSVVTEFLRSHPAQPVISVRVDPGEAYIAPTESIIHDASSLEMRAEDAHITGRGVFEPSLL
jgi:hypothetical protein